MELEIKKYLAFIAILFTSFALVHHYTVTQVNRQQDAYYWQMSGQSLSSTITSPKTFISHKDGQTTITWTGYTQPVDVQKCLSLESGSWTTISKNNSSGKFVDTDAKEPMAFYRISYTAQL